MSFRIAADALMRTIVFFFDFMSPYAYLAAQRLPALAERYGCNIEYCPIDLAMAKRAVGNSGPANRNIPAKHKYLRLDLQRWAQVYQVPLVPPPEPYNSARLNRGTFFAIDRGVVTRYVLEAWHVVWGCGGDMNDPSLFSKLCAMFAWDLETFQAYADSPSAHERYAAAQERARQLGVFGVPMIHINDEIWWGNDRLQFVERYLAAHASSGQKREAT